MNAARIVEVPLMSDDAEVLDSLSRAILEFRDEILLSIDTALVRLREREQDESVALEERSAPARLTPWGKECGSQTHSPDPRSNSTPVDSFQRLDALARLLDQRLKSSQEAVSNSPGASGEVGESNA
jgi:hypothetical protein